MAIIIKGCVRYLIVDDNGDEYSMEFLFEGDSISDFKGFDDLSSNNIVLRNISRLYGGKGPYHLVHHSAYLRDQNINFSGAPFMFWDRLFGTYRQPYGKLPPLDLTDNPPIIKNPFRIIYGGIAQLWYELKQ